MLDLDLCHELAQDPFLFFYPCILKKTLLHKIRFTAAPETIIQSI